MPPATTVKLKALNLIPVFDRLNNQYFGNMIVAGICWRPLSIAPENVIYGQCVFAERMIQINTLLRMPKVPQFFVEYIVFHEMCHLAYHPAAAESDGHTDTEHNDRFLALEKRFIHYNQAMDFERDHMFSIIKEARSLRKK